MTVLAFDTHAFVKRLIGAGMPEAQAEVLAEEQVRLLDHRLATKDDVAAVQAQIQALRQATEQDLEAHRHAIHQKIETLRQELKQDIEALRQELKQDIEALRHELKQDIAAMRTEMRELEHRLTLRMGTMLAAAVAIVTALVKLL